MIFHLQWLIQRLLAFLDTSGQTLDDSLQGPIVEKSTAVPILATERGNDTVHGRLVSVVRPDLHQVANVADIGSLDRGHVVPCPCGFVEDFKAAD